MAIVVADRVLETSTTSGTGTLTLAGAGSGYQSFTVGVGVGNQTYYTIYDPTALTWEVGIGTLLTGSTLSRTTVYANSSGTTALISFAANSKNVFCTSPASRYVDQSDVGTAPNQVPLNQYLGKLAFEDVVDTISSNPYYDTQISDVEPTLNLDFVNSKIVDPRISFTRSTTATYYGPNISALAEQNLFLQSQFASGWSNYQDTLVVSGSITDPTGSTNAATMTAANAGGGQSYQNMPYIAGQVYTLSVYAKAGTSNYIYFQQNSATPQALAWFNVSTGLVGTKNTGAISSSIVSVGNGWYRCVVTFLAFATNSAVTTAIGLADNDASTLTTVGTTSYLWGAQLEQRSSATAYNATTTTALTNYIPALQTAAINAPRLDFSPTAGTPNGLLIEESRSNLLTYSQDFTQSSAWSYNASILGPSIIAPDGTNSAGKIVGTATTAFHYFGRVSNISASAVNNTFSFYAKKGEYTGVTVRMENASGTQNNSGFDLTNGNIVVNLHNCTSTSIGNGWYRFTLTTTGFSGSYSIYIYANPVATSSQVATLGDGYSGIYIWGAQLEAGAFATSYIPTLASTVVRSAETAIMSGTNFSSWYSIGQGTVYSQAVSSNTALATTFSILSINDGTSSNVIREHFNSGLLYGVVTTNGTNLAVLSGTATPSVPNKESMSYKPNSFVSSVNNSSVSSALSGAVPSGMTNLKIGSDYSGAFQINGWIQKLQYYPVALSNAELQEMTL